MGYSDSAQATVCIVNVEILFCHGMSLELIKVHQTVLLGPIF